MVPTYVFYFKIAYTNTTKYYTINANVTITEFLEDIVIRIRNDFNIEPEVNIEIVEAGQYNNIYGRDAEVAPQLEPSNRIVRQVYGRTYKQIPAFYIR